MNKSKHINNKMNTSHNHLHEPCSQESSFLKARAYLSDLSKPEKEVLMTNLGVGAGKICVENFPDEEDLTTEMRGSRNVLKFKDKIFNPAKCSGMGKVFLRKNMVKDVNNCGKPINILTQDMFEDEHGLPLINTIFIIQYDYDLDKGFITIPENSVLVFAGGSFRNGTVILKNTLMLPAGLDIEHFMSVNIRGNYKEGSLVYLRKHLRLFNGQNWVNIGGPADFTPQDKLEIINVLKKYVNATLDIVSPFKITITPEKNYIETGEHDIKVSWDYNRLINNQDIRLESGNKYAIYKELNKCVREYTFEGIDAEDPVTIVISTTYKGETVSEAITLTFNQNPGLIIDDELNEDSTNPVTNKAITRIIRQLENNIDSVDEKFENYVDIQEFNEYKTEVNTDLSEINQRFNEYKTEINADLSEINQELNNKVDKISGKGLSTNDFTDAHKNKLEGINLDNYALKNHTHDNYANINHTHSQYATTNHTHSISDITGLAEALNRAGVTYTISKDGTTLYLIGSDGSRSSVTISGIDENALGLLIESKLRLSHGNGTISLKYGTTDLGTVNDEKGSGDGGGMTENEVRDLIKNNLDVTHVGNLIKLQYGNSTFGTGTTDMTGGGDDPGDDGLPGNILIYFLKTNPITGVPKTPQDGQISDLETQSGTWQDFAPNHEDGKYIWMSQIYETHTGNSYGNWSYPILIDDGSSSSSAGSDTANIEFIFARANIEDWELAGIGDPADYPASQSDDYIPDPLQNRWFDTPQGITEDMRYEFISYRTKSDGNWSKFTHPALWSSYGHDGTDGAGVEYIFFKGRTAPLDNATQNPNKWYTDEQSKADVNKQSYNHDEYIKPGSGWVDDPVNIEPGESVWVSIRKYRNDTDAESAEAVGAYWHQYSEPALWSHYGKDSISAGILDFDNETMTVPVNSETGKNYQFADVAFGYIFYGEGTINISNLTYNGLYDGDQQITNSHVHVQIQNNKVTVSIDTNGLDFSQIKNYTLRFTAQASGVEDRTGIIKLIGISSGKDGESYKLSLNTTVIKKQVGTQSGLYIPDSITPELVIIGGEKEGTYTPTEIGNDSSLSQRFQIKYGYDGHALQPLSTNSIPVTSSITNFIVVALFYNNDLVDQETVFIITDGHDGIPASVYNIIPISSTVKYENGETSGTVSFKASRQIGSNPIEYLNTNSDWGVVATSLQKSGDSHDVNPTLSGDVFTASFQNVSGEYDYVKIELSVSNTLVCTVIVPVIKGDSSGTQTLELSVLREKVVALENYNSQVQFYCGRNVAENGIKYQDFIKWKGTVDGKSPNDSWGTYLCISDYKPVVQNIPSDVEHFVKLDYNFSVVADYLIASEGFIESLSVNQLAVLNNSKQEVVAGMTSGDRLPEAAGQRTNNNDIRIWAGSVPSNGDISSAAFTVDSSGHVEATDAEITGDVTATSFSVVDSSDHNKVMMEMTTWGNVSNDIDTTKIDSDTLNKLTSNTPVIVVTDENGNQYILNMLAFSSGSEHLPVRYFYNINKINGVVTTNRNFITQYDESTDIYYDQNGQNPLNNVTAYELVKSNDVIFGGDPIYAVLPGNIYQGVNFVNGKKQSIGRRYLIAKKCSIKINSSGNSWRITVEDPIDYVYNTNKEVSLADSFNNYAFSTSSTKDVVIGQGSIGTEIRKILDNQFPATIKLVKVNYESANALSSLDQGITSIDEGQYGGTFITI